MYPISVILRCGVCGKKETVNLETDGDDFYVAEPGLDSEEYDIEEEIKSLFDIINYTGYKHKRDNTLAKLHLFCSDCWTKIKKIESKLEKEKQKQLAAVMERTIKDGR